MEEKLKLWFETLGDKEKPDRDTYGVVKIKQFIKWKEKWIDTQSHIVIAVEWTDRNDQSGQDQCDSQ